MPPAMTRLLERWREKERVADIGDAGPQGGGGGGGKAEVAVVAADEQLLVADSHQNSAILDLPIAFRTFLCSHDFMISWLNIVEFCPT